MKRVLAWLMVLMLLCGLGGAQALADGENEICGSYVLADMDDGSGEDIAALLPMMEAMGMSATLVINEDGTAEMDMFGEKAQMTFDFERKVMTAEGEEIPYTYEDGVLTLAEDEMSLTFQKDGLSAPKGVGPFTYYTLESYTEEKETELGKKEKSPDQDKEETVPSLVLYQAGDAVMDFYGEVTELQFDFEAMTVTFGEEPLPFTLEDGLLSFQNEAGAAFAFREADPGFVGPYVMVGIASEEEGDMTEQLAILAALDMAPTLTIDEDGKGELELFGEKLVMTFDFEAMTFTSEEDEEAVPFIYENGKLTLEQDGNSLQFARVMPEKAEESAETAEAETASKS